MERPWYIDDTDEVRLAPLQHPTIEPGDWNAVERYLGLALPRDYKDLIGDGRTMVFDGELFIASPFDPAFNLFDRAAHAAWAEASVRHHSPADPLVIYPEPGGILSWGGDGGGALYHWDTATWDVVVTGRPVHPPERHAMTLTAYLAALADGSIEAAAVTGWPGPHPQLRRRGDASTRAGS